MKTMKFILVGACATALTMSAFANNACEQVKEKCMHSKMAPAACEKRFDACHHKMAQRHERHERHAMKAHKTAPASTSTTPSATESATPSSSTPSNQ